MRRAVETPGLWERLVAGIRRAADPDAAARHAHLALYRGEADETGGEAGTGRPARPTTPGNHPGEHAQARCPTTTPGTTQGPQGYRRLSSVAVAELPTADAPAADRPVELQGLVDNATNTRMYGWAWNAARPEEHVTVELRLGEETVATAVADRERPDLAKAGVGDGCHAFELPLTPEWVSRRSEMSVVARTADGGEHALPLRIRRADVDPSGSIQRVLEATANAHRPTASGAATPVARRHRSSRGRGTGFSAAADPAEASAAADGGRCGGGGAGDHRDGPAQARAA